MNLLLVVRFMAILFWLTCSCILTSEQGDAMKTSLPDMLDGGEPFSVTPAQAGVQISLETALAGFRLAPE
jgi:hypothetical protein